MNFVYANYVYIYMYIKLLTDLCFGVYPLVRAVQNILAHFFAMIDTVYVYMYLPKHV